MKKILIILLTLCLFLSFSVPSYAAFSTESYQILFKTKASYENTEYEEIFSDHRNFLKPEVFGIPELYHDAYWTSYWASYDINKSPHYIIHFSAGFSSPTEAAKICTELVRRGIAEWAVFGELNDFNKMLKFYSSLERGLVKFSGDSFGDINCDENVSSEDARIALRISVGLESKGDYPFLFGDMDHDGEITSSDARQILRVATGLDGYATTD